MKEQSMEGGGREGGAVKGGWDHYVDSRPYPDPAAPDGPATRFDPGASTGRLMLRRFLRHRLAVLGALFLGLSYLSLPFVDFLVPYGANERDVESLTLLVCPDSTRASTSARLRPRSAVAGMEGASLGVLMSSFAFRAYNGHYPLLAAAVRRWYISTLILP